jgi:branched-chain amino acid aminotransferase
MDVVFHNGEFMSRSTISISEESRAFNYGDGFFESIKIINSRPFNFSCHYERIILGFSVLRMNNIYSLSFFEEKIFQLIKLNRITYGNIKIHISRIGAGKYLPESNNSQLLIVCSSGYEYRYNSAISLCFYEEQLKPTGNLSNIKSANSLVSVLASIYANENNFDNAILLNNSGHIIEASNANIFIVKNKKIHTPKIDHGCIHGTMRSWICNEFEVFDKVISKNDVKQSDEVFITNATLGVIPVKTIEDISFSSFSKARLIQQNLVNLN